MIQTASMSTFSPQIRVQWAVLFFFPLPKTLSINLAKAILPLEGAVSASASILRQ